MSEQRKQCSPQEKVSILKRHLIEGVPVSDLCDQHGIHPTVFYRWQKVFFENGAAAFAHQQAAAEKYLEKKIVALEAKLSQKNEVLSEVMEEHVRLKSCRGER